MNCSFNPMMRQSWPIIALTLAFVPACHSKTSLSPNERKEMCDTLQAIPVDPLKLMRAEQEQHEYEIARMRATICVSRAAIDLARTVAPEEATEAAMRLCHAEVARYDAADEYSRTMAQNQTGIALQTEEQVRKLRREMLARPAEFAAANARKYRCWEVVKAGG